MSVNWIKKEIYYIPKNGKIFLLKLLENFKKVAKKLKKIIKKIQLKIKKVKNTTFFIENTILDKGFFKITKKSKK